MPKVEATWRAPGRVNFIGEHTDYTGGFALPFAITAACTATVTTAATTAGALRISSAQRDEPVHARAGHAGAGHRRVGRATRPA